MSDSAECLQGVLLAAGGSRRLGRPKQLVEWQGMSLVRRAAELALMICDAGLVVVTGAEAQAVVAELASLDVQFTHNEHWEEGLGSSLRAGLGALSAGATATLLMVCDQPRINAEDLQALRSAWRQNPGRPAAAAYADTIGVPAIVPLGFRDELINALAGDRGAGRWLGEQADVSAVAMPNAALDLDTEADLGRLQAD
jgi:CTP:molybdopterin cytidylyltransferase MocA